MGKNKHKGKGAILITPSGLQNMNAYTKERNPETVNKRERKSCNELIDRVH